MTDFTLRLLGLSAVMAAVILLLVLFKKPFGKLSPRSRYVIWALVILRLSVPVTVGAPSLFTFELPSTFFSAETVQTDAVTPSVEQTVPLQTSAVTDSVHQSLPVTVTDSEVSMQTFPSADPIEPPAVLPEMTQKLPEINTGMDNTEPNHVTDSENGEDFGGVDTEKLICGIFTVWAVGGASFFAWRMIAYSTFVICLKKKGMMKVTDGSVAEIYTSAGAKLGLKRLPELYMACYPVSPMIYGYLKPKLLIPDLEFSDEDSVRTILVHELIHYKRGDLYAKLVCTVAEAIHWFNPMVHKACAYFNSTMEISCDDAVVRKLDLESRTAYSDTLLDMVRRCEGVKEQPLTTALNGNAGAIKERIMNILDTGKKKRGIGIIAAVLALCMIAGVAVGCAVKDDTDVPDVPVTETGVTYYVPEYMKLVSGSDTYEVNLRFEEDRLEAERTKNDEADVTYTASYDTDRLVSVEVKNADGELLRTKSFTYDESGNVKYIRHTDADGSLNFGFTEYTYENGLLKSIYYKADNDPSGVDIRYFYDEHGRISTVKNKSWLFEEIRYTYDAEGRIVETGYYGSPDPYYTNLKKTVTAEFRDDGRSAVMTEVDKSGGKSDIIYTYTYDGAGRVLTARVDCELGRYDADNVPNYAVQSNTYSEDGRHIICQTVEGNNFTLENNFREYRGSFDGEKLESSEVILHGTQIKWRRCSESEYLCYRAVYEAFDTTSEEAEAGYLLKLESHMWCFDDVVSDISVDTEPYTVFEGNAVFNETDARKVWYEANGFSSDRKSGIVEAFLTNDVDKLAEYAYAAKGAYEGYIGMKLGDYKLESRKGKDGGNVIVLTVDILESNHEILVPGTHTFIAEEGINVMLYPENMYESMDSIVYEELFNKRAAHLFRYGIVDFEEFKNGINGEYNKLATYFCIYGMYDNMEKYYEIMEKNENKGFLAEDIKAYAEKYFGVSDFEPPKEHGTGNRVPYSYYDSYYKIIGRGDSAVAFSYEDQTVDGDRVIVTVTGWADLSMTVKSKTVEYVFEKLDESVKIISARVLEDTGYELAFGQGT